MVQVKFFSSLREQVGRAEAELDWQSPLSILEIWQKTAPDCTLPANTLCAINMEYAKLEDMVKDNDEVAFFPPVTGG